MKWHQNWKYDETVDDQLMGMELRSSVVRYRLPEPQIVLPMYAEKEWLEAILEVSSKKSQMTIDSMRYQNCS